MSQHSVINEATWGLNVPAFQSKSQDVMKDACLVNASAKIPSSWPSFLKMQRNENHSHENLESYRESQ